MMSRRASWSYTRFIWKIWPSPFFVSIFIRKRDSLNATSFDADCADTEKHEQHQHRHDLKYGGNNRVQHVTTGTQCDARYAASVSRRKCLHTTPCNIVHRLITLSPSRFATPTSFSAMSVARRLKNDTNSSMDT